MENKVLLLSFLCSTDIYSSSFKIFLACILGFSQLQCDCYYTHNIFSWKLFASAQEVGKTHVLWVSELTSSLPWLSHPGCLFWAGTDDAGEERQIAISPRSGILSFSHSYLSLFSVFSFRNFSFSTQDFSSLALQLLIITIVSTITALSLFAFFILNDCTSWTPSNLSNNFLSKLRQGHRAVLNQTRLWVTDSWSPGLSISRWQHIHICTRAKEYVPRLCALLWTQKTRMFLFVSSDPLCFEAEAPGKKQGLFIKVSKHHLFLLFLKSLKKN